MPQPPTGTVTFLFTDIEGSTARWDTQREAMAAALVRHDALLRGAIEGRGRFLAEEGLFERLEAEGGFPNAEAVERWKLWMTLSDAAFEAALSDRFRPARQVEPLFWRDARLNAPSQPVVVAAVPVS